MVKFKWFKRYLPKFDVYNCATALHKCGLQARDDELVARQIQSDPNFIKLFATAKRQTLSKVNELESSTLGLVKGLCSVDVMRDFS